MKITLFAYLAVVGVVTASFQPKSPLVFFADIDGVLEPLCGKLYGNDLANSYSFVYGDPTGDPIEFVLEDNVAFTKQNGEWHFAGFYEDDFLFGGFVVPKSLELDENGKISSGQLYSCGLMGGPAHGSVHGSGAQRFHYCHEVDVYLLPYNRETRSPIYSAPEVGARRIPPSVEHDYCSLHYYGTYDDKALVEFLLHYDGECEIFINGNLQQL